MHKAAVGAVSMGTAAFVRLESSLMGVRLSLEGFTKVITIKGFLAAVTALRHRVRLEIRV